MPFDIEEIRSRFPVVKNAIYLNSGWSGPSSSAVVDRVLDWLRWEAEFGPTSPIVLEKVSSLGAEARTLLGEVMGASANEISLLENTTEGINTVINGISWQPGDEVVTCNLEHGSILVPVCNLRDTRGVSLKVVAIGLEDDTDTIVEKFAAAMTARTKLLAISEISYSTGIRLPLARLVEAAHAVGAKVLVDGAQTAGHIELDCHGTNVDYYAFTGHKWMLGPDGSGALYVREDLIEDLAPSKLSGHAATSFDLEGGWTPNRASIQKFELTTRSSALLTGMIAALEEYRGVGAAVIENRTRDLGKALRGKLATVPKLTVLSPDSPDRSCGLVVFKIDGKAPEDITKAIWERRQIVMRTVSWPGGVRASCHYFNHEDELNILVDQLSQIANEA